MEVMIVIIYLLLSTGGLIAIKYGADSVVFKVNQGMVNFSINFISLIGLILYISSFLIFTFVIVKKYNLTYIMPILTGASQILILISGFLVFKEKVSNFGILGIALVLVGIVLLNLK